MNWYKKAQSSLVDEVDTGIAEPPDIDDGDDDDEEYEWAPCLKVIMKWVKDNLNNDSILSIQNQLVETIALGMFEKGIYPETMLWHEDLDFFEDQAYRALTVSLRFAGFNGTATGTDAEYPYVDIKSMQSKWQGLLQQSNLLQVIQGSGCKVNFIDEDLYEFVLGEICNALCYQNKQIAETFQLYLDKNIEKMQKEIIQDLSGGELSRYMTPKDFSRITLGKEVDVTNGGMHCNPSDFRFDTVGIVITSEMTMYLNVPDDISERVLLQKEV
tara:strand:- start:14293 stop:15105 length:813 start_codon:yes stop_codon:yes gene_type:complete